MADGDVPVRRHATHPDWLVDDRGHTWRRERFWTCEHHPYGPPHDDEIDDEHEACAAVARGLWRELGTVAAIQTVTGATIGEIEASRQELGLCCIGERWRNTGKLVEVTAMEQFIYENMRAITGPIAESLRGSVLLDEINRAGAAPWQGTDGQQVRIPLVVHAGTPLPRSAAAEAADEQT